MSDHEAIVSVVSTFLRAQLLGDAALLATASLPHPELGLLVAKPKRAVSPAALQGLEQMQVACDEIGDGRWFVRPYVNGSIQLMIVQDTPDGPRVDPRYAIEAQRPDDERRRVARSFYLAMLLGDGDTLRELAFDPRGVELLAGDRPPSGEHGQLEHVAAIMGLARLAPGEAFQVPTGVQFVDARHAEMGIEVWKGLTPDGEIPFLLRQREGRWKVIPFHFIQAAVQARGGTIGP